MRLISISAISFGALACFGLGVIVGKFVLTERLPEVVSADLSLENSFDSLGTDNIIASDPALMLPPVQAGKATEKKSAEAVNCDTSVSRSIAVSSWTDFGTIKASINGQNCFDALIKINVSNSSGKSLMTISSPAALFGIKNDTSIDAIKKLLEASLPDSAIRAAAYPEWSETTKPEGTEFTKDSYEALRAANLPVLCFKLPNSPQTCLASDPNTGKFLTLNRG